MFEELGEYNQPPRMLYTGTEFGMPFGKPNDLERQMSTLSDALKLFTI
jgi:hypothetical protein